MKSFKPWWVVVLLVLVGTVLMGCATPVALPPVAPQEAATPQPIKVRFRLNWTLYGEHAPFFLALDKGFYAEEGLDVEILEGSGSATTVKLIGNGTDPIGYADAGTMMKGVAVGVPVKAVAVLVQQNPMAAIYVKEKTKLDSAQDLIGKKIGLTTGDSLSQIFPAVLSKNGISEDQVEIVSLANPAAKETALLQGQVDAFLGYFIDQPPRIEYRTGIDLDWIKFSDMGVNTLSGAIIVNNRTIEENPELVRKFVRATLRGVKCTMENPDEAARIFASHTDQFDEKLARLEIELTLGLLHTPRTEGKPIGWMSPEDWAETQDILAQYAGLKPEPDINVYFTNEFIPDEIPGC